MQLPTSGQVAAAGRHVVSFIAGGVTVAAGLHLLSGTNASTITTSVQHIEAGVAEIAAGLGPLVAILSGWYAAWSASHIQQLKSVEKAVNSGTLKDVAIVPVGPAAPIAAPIGPKT